MITLKISSEKWYGKYNNVKLLRQYFKISFITIWQGFFGVIVLDRAADVVISSM
jgi:hypothetical protein